MQSLIQNNSNYYVLGHQEDRLDKLKYRFGVSLKAISDAIGLKYTTFRSRVQNDKLSYEDLRKISNKFNVNLEWLESGKGEIELSTYQKASTNPTNVSEDAAKYNAIVKMNSGFMMQVPIVQKLAYAGYLSGFGDPEWMESLPTIPWLVDHEPKGNYLTLEVRGDSMDDGTIDSYPEGCFVLCRELQRQHWVNTLHMKQYDFVIVHRQDGILIKRIVNHNTQNGVLTLHSLNDLYEDFEVEMDDIVQIFNVVQITRKAKR